MSALPLPEGVPGVPPGLPTIVSSALRLFGGGGSEPPPGYRRENWVRLQGNAAAGFSIGTSELPGFDRYSEAERNAIANVYNERLRLEYDPRVLEQFSGQVFSGPPGSTYEQLLAKLFAGIQPARNLTGAIAQSARGGAQIQTAPATYVQRLAYAPRELEQLATAPAPGGVHSTTGQVIAGLAIAVLIVLAFGRR
jgi:hypothetical protein